jgi:glycosyltransferase involved in cell wall biosynthesis
MRIIYLHQYFATPQMAGGSRSYEMARRLVAAGHEVHMVTSDRDAVDPKLPWRHTVEAGVDVHWTPVAYDNSMGYGERMRAFLRFAWRATRKAVKLRGDVVFATSTPLTIALPAVYAARRLRVPMVFEVRDLWPEVPIAIGAIRSPVAVGAARWLERFAYRNAARVVALAPGMRDSVVATGYPRERVAVIPNGCDLDLFADPDAGRRLREEFSWLGRRPLLVFTGTFGIVTGMDYLVRVAAAISRIDSEVRIVAVGGGREFDRTRQLALDLGVLDKNLFLPGKLRRPEAVAWTHAADMTIALLTGPEVVWRDAVQNKFFDSLAAGKPVANNFRGWQSELAVGAGAGLIVSASDVDAAAGDLVRALRDREWLDKAGRAARELGGTQFNRDSLAIELERILLEVYPQSHSVRKPRRVLPV